MGLKASLVASSLDIRAHTPRLIRRMAEDSPDTIGRRIRAARRARGLSQNQLATLIGVVESTLSRYERALLVPGADHLAAIADACDVKLDALVPPRPQVRAAS